MKHFCVTFISLCFNLLQTYAQTTKVVTGTYTFYVPENVSLEEAKHISVNRAKASAIADAFGTLVTQNNATTISNINGKAENRFLSIGGSEIKGEWLKTIEKPIFKIRYEVNNLVVKVTIKGVVREIPKNNFILNTTILRNGITNKYESDDFRNGDDMYFRFSAPTDGYLLAYLYDETSDMVYCLLPYISENSIGYQKIIGGKDYLFFKKDKLQNNADEYTLIANSAKTEFETLYIIFSTQPIYMPRNICKEKTGMRSVPYKDFTKWLVNIRKNQETKVIEKMITIKP